MGSQQSHQSHQQAEQQPTALDAFWDQVSTIPVQVPDEQQVDKEKELEKQKGDLGGTSIVPGEPKPTGTETNVDREESRGGGRDMGALEGDPLAASLDKLTFNPVQGKVGFKTDTSSDDVKVGQELPKKPQRLSSDTSLLSVAPSHEKTLVLSSKPFVVPSVTVNSPWQLGPRTVKFPRPYPDDLTLVRFRALLGKAFETAKEISTWAPHVIIPSVLLVLHSLSADDFVEALLPCIDGPAAAWIVRSLDRGFFSLKEAQEQLVRLKLFQHGVFLYEVSALPAQVNGGSSYEDRPHATLRMAGSTGLCVSRSKTYENPKHREALTRDIGVAMYGKDDKPKIKKSRLPKKPTRGVFGTTYLGRTVPDGVRFSSESVMIQVGGGVRMSSRRKGGHLRPETEVMNAEYGFEHHGTVGFFETVQAFRDRIDDMFSQRGVDLTLASTTKAACLAFSLPVSFYAMEQLDRKPSHRVYIDLSPKTYGEGKGTLRLRLDAKDLAPHFIFVHKNGRIENRDDLVQGNASRLLRSWSRTWPVYLEMLRLAPFRGLDGSYEREVYLRLVAVADKFEGLYEKTVRDFGISGLGRNKTIGALESIKELFSGRKTFKVRESPSSYWIDTLRIHDASRKISLGQQHSYIDKDSPACKRNLCRKDVELVASVTLINGTWRTTFRFPTGESFDSRDFLKSQTHWDTMLKSLHPVYQTIEKEEADGGDDDEDDDDLQATLQRIKAMEFRDVDVGKDGEDIKSEGLLGGKIDLKVLAAEAGDEGRRALAWFKERKGSIARVQSG